jgi:hypothetical protein
VKSTRIVLTPAPPAPSVFPSVPGHIAAPATQAQERDIALDRLEAARGELIELAYDIAYTLWSQNGRVSSTEVWLKLFTMANSTVWTR